MKSISILLTDPISINQKIILKSIGILKKSKLKKIYFLGDRNYFKDIEKISKKNNKFYFINICLIKKKYLQYLASLIKTSIYLFKKKKINYIVNMPINKKRFFKNKYPGFTEFFSYRMDKKKNENMILYNEKFSVCPLTTHTEIKNVDKKINKRKLISAINNLNFFLKNIIKKKKKIIVLGLNPHASQDITNNTKDIKIISPVVRQLKKKIDICGPVSADTAFHQTKGKIYLGMYHDQVLIPFKMANKYNGINITVGKNIIRISPDHGTGEDLIRKPHLISNKSFLQCIKFCEKY